MRILNLTPGRARAASVALAGLVGLGAVAGALVHQPGPIGARPVADAGGIDPGSCATVDPAPGFVIDLCLTGTGPSVTPAVIVHQAGYIASSCRITLGVFDDANNRLDDPAHAVALPCTLGEHDAAALDLSQLSGVTADTAPDGSITVHASADLTVDGQETNLGASPTYTDIPRSAPAPTPDATAPSQTPADSGDDYPPAWRNQRQDSFAIELGGNRECVSFVAWKIYEANGGTQVPTTNQPPSDYLTHSINVAARWGDAYNWGYYARSHGIPVASTPSVGSVAWWDRTGVWAAHGTGHVAYVTAVQNDASGNITGFDIAQYNIEGNDGTYSTAHFTLANGSLASVTNTTPSGYPLAGHDFNWIPMPDGFISDIQGGS